MEEAGGRSIPGYKPVAETVFLQRKTLNINKQRWLDAAKEAKGQPLVKPWDEMNAIVSRTATTSWTRRSPPARRRRGSSARSTPSWPRANRSPKSCRCAGVPRPTSDVVPRRGQTWDLGLGTSDLGPDRRGSGHGGDAAQDLLQPAAHGELPRPRGLPLQGVAGAAPAPVRAVGAEAPPAVCVVGVAGAGADRAPGAHPAHRGVPQDEPAAGAAPGAGAPPPPPRCTTRGAPATSPAPPPPPAGGARWGRARPPPHPGPSGWACPRGRPR